MTAKPRVYKSRDGNGWILTYPSFKYQAIILHRRCATWAEAMAHVANWHTIRKENT